MGVCCITVYIKKGDNKVIPCQFAATTDNIPKSAEDNPGTYQQIQWLDNQSRDVTSRQRSSFSVDNNYELVINGAQIDDSGLYSCILGTLSGTTIDRNIHKIRIGGLS